MYAAFYRLRALPFQLGPDPRFFFGSSGHSKALAYLTYGLEQGEGFIVITGEVGAGKTTLVGHLFDGLDDERFVAAKIVTTQLDAEGMLRAIAGGFGLPTEGADKATLLKRLETFLDNNHRAGKRNLLVVDEAQNVGIPALEELRMLSNFQNGQRTLLQTFLLGQPQFRDMLVRPELEQLRQRIIASYHLEPMSAPETSAYVLHRLQTVGWDNDPVFSAEALTAIHARTNGIPRRINTLCSRLLLYGFLEQSHKIDAAVVEQVADEMAAELPQRPKPQILASSYGLDDLDQRLRELQQQVRAQDHGIQYTPVRQRPHTAPGPVNALTVDVEDWFHVQAFADAIRPEDWPYLESRVVANTERILELLADHGLCATFFTLGWVAERHKELIRRIVGEGHELASHGYAHRRVDQQTPAAFRSDVARTRKLLEDIGGVPVRGYRAASFSIGPNNLWAHEVLADEGYDYSSSIYPVKHDIYGMPEAPRFAFRPRGRNGVIELPMTTARIFGKNRPIGGGGYFRARPYWLSRSRMRRVNRSERQPCIFYFHPWEIDPEQPRQSGVPVKSRLRHYTGLRRMEPRLKRLFKDFNWDRMDAVFDHHLAKVPA